jgi:hypothetical protein
VNDVEKAFMAFALLCSMFASRIHANEKGGVGSVTFLKGKAFITSMSNATSQLNLLKGSPIKEGDTINTADDSFLKIKFQDNSLISLGPNSKFLVEKFQIQNEKRTSIYNLLVGKIRTLIQKKRKDGEVIQLKVGLISLGVRGTEILANAYLVKGKQVSDAVLTKGQVSLDVQGSKVSGHLLKAGKAVNSSAVQAKGLSSIKTLSAKEIALIANSSNFLPNLQNTDGSFSEFGNSPNDNSIKKNKIETKEIPNVVVLLKDATKENTTVKGPIGFKYNLKTEHILIRETLLSRKRDRAENDCYYFIHKTPPGGGNLELFKRTRDCDEFDYEL